MKSEWSACSVYGTGKSTGQSIPGFLGRGRLFPVIFWAGLVLASRKQYWAWDHSERIENALF